MIKNQFVNQKKQKILNYQIKMIEKCTDSLFTEVNCNHERYLAWNLGQSLKNLLQNYHYKFRWIGNDSNSYVYAYFYIVIVGCAAQPNYMLQLKIVLYQLGRKYLAQYEQKLLIQFLCLIEYSQDKFMFFRNYSKIQVILLKIFKQIETRNSLTAFSTKDFKQQDNTLSKLGTQITSPSKSKMTDETNKLLRNSDYYNSSIKRIEMEYRADLVKRQKKLSNYNRVNFINWYQCYGTIFKFMKMTVLSQQNVKFQILDPNKQKFKQQFIITTEKGCFFVIQMINIDRYTNNQLQTRSDKSASILDQQRNYLNSLIQRELKQTKIKKEYNDFTKTKSKNDSLLFTPKFISNKKKLSLVGNDLYNDDSLTKNIQIQVLNVSQFNENKQSEVKIKNEEENNYDFHKKKVNHLDNFKSTIKSIHEDKLQPPHKHFPLFNFLRNSNKAIKTEQQISNHQNNHYLDLKKLQFSSHQHIPSGRNFQIEPNEIKIGWQKQNNGGAFIEGNKNQTLPIIRNNPQMKEINVNNISSIPPNETILSAVNIKKRYNIGNQFRKNLFQCDNKRLSPREVHSYSPPNHLIGVRPVHFYSPNRVVLTQNSVDKKPTLPKQIKFTYV